MYIWEMSICSWKDGCQLKLTLAKSYMITVRTVATKQHMFMIYAIHWQTIQPSSLPLASAGMAQVRPILQGIIAPWWDFTRLCCTANSAYVLVANTTTLMMLAKTPIITHVLRWWETGFLEISSKCRAPAREAYGSLCVCGAGLRMEFVYEFLTNELKLNKERILCDILWW